MEHGITIHPDVVKGLEHDLKNPDVLQGAHALVRGSNPLLHTLHEGVIVGLKTSTQYDDAIINAVGLGAETYEAFTVTSVEPIPSQFALTILSVWEKDPNFGLFLGEQMQQARERLHDTQPALAAGVHTVCEAHVGSPLAATYSVAGAGVLDLIYREADQMWQLEKQFQQAG